MCDDTVRYLGLIGASGVGDSGQSAQTVLACLSVARLRSRSGRLIFIVDIISIPIAFYSTLFDQRLYTVICTYIK